jgi:hypothetical protein
MPAITKTRVNPLKTVKIESIMGMSKITFIIMTVLMARIMLTVQYDIDDASAKKHMCAEKFQKIKTCWR